MCAAAGWCWRCLHCLLYTSQRAQFLLLSDRSSQGSVTALLRRYAEDIRTPEQLFEPDDGPVAKRLHLYPAAVFGEKFLYPPAAQRTAEPLAPVRTEAFDPEQLRREQQLLLDYARLAVTEENVALLARQALAARPQDVYKRQDPPAFCETAKSRGFFW